MRRERTAKMVAAKTAVTLPGALALYPSMAQAAPGDSGYWHWGWGWGHMVFGSVMMILLWGGLILVIVLAVRWAGRGSAQGTIPRPPEPRPLDILRERFAQGEIDKQEFEERRRLLSH